MEQSTKITMDIMSASATLGGDLAPHLVLHIQQGRAASCYLLTIYSSVWLVYAGFNISFVESIIAWVEFGKHEKKTTTKQFVRLSWFNLCGDYVLGYWVWWLCSILVSCWSGGRFPPVTHLSRITINNVFKDCQVLKSLLDCSSPFSWLYRQVLKFLDVSLIHAV